MTGDGSFFPDPPDSQCSSHNAKSILNYHPVLEFNGNRNDFWLLFDDSDILERHQSRPLRKPPQTCGPGSSKSKGLVSKPGFTNTFVEASSSKSGFLRPDDDDDDDKSQKIDSKDRLADDPDGKKARLDRLIRSGIDAALKSKERVGERRRSRSRERRRSRSNERRRGNSRERRRSRSLERRRSRSPGRRRSPVRGRRDYGSRRRSRSREGRGRDRPRSKDRQRTSRERDSKRGSPSSSRMSSRSKRSASISSNASNDEADKAGKDDLLNKFAEKLQEKAKPVNKSLSSIRLNSRLEDTKHRRAEPITPIVFSLKKPPSKSFASTLLQKVEEKKKDEKKKDEASEEKSEEPMDISDPSETVSSSIEIPVNNSVPPTSIAPMPSHPLVTPPPVSQTQPLRITDGVTVACAPTLYKDGKKAPVTGAIIKLPPVVVSQPPAAVSQAAPVTHQPSLGSTSAPKVTQIMEAPAITEMHQNLASQALQYAAFQQNVTMPPPDFGQMMSGPPPGHGMAPGMMGPGHGPMVGGPGFGIMGHEHFGPIGPGHHGPEGPFMGPPPHGPEGQFMGPPPHGPEGPFMGPPPHGPEGPFMGPPHHGPEGPFMGPPPHGPEGPFMGPPPHGPRGPFMGPPHHGPEGPFMGPPHHGPEGPFMGPPPHGPEGPFMGPPPHGPGGPYMGPPPHGPGRPFMGPPPYGVRPPFMGPPRGIIEQSEPPQSNNITVPISQKTPPAFDAAAPAAFASQNVEGKEKKTTLTPKSTPSTQNKDRPASSVLEKPSSVPQKEQTPPKPKLSTLKIPNLEKLRFMLVLVKFLQHNSELKKQILELEKSQSEEFCIKCGLLCKVKKDSEDQVLVIMVPENANARRTIVTAVVLKHPDLDLDALIELFEQSFHSMPMEDIEDVFEDESTRNSKLLATMYANYSTVEEILPCGTVILKGSKKKDVEDMRRSPSEKSAKTESSLSSSKSSKSEELKVTECSVGKEKSVTYESSNKNVGDGKTSASSDSKKTADSLNPTGLQNEKSAAAHDAASEKHQTSEKSTIDDSLNVAETLMSSRKADSPVMPSPTTDVAEEKAQASNVACASSVATESSTDDLNKEVDSASHAVQETSSSSKADSTESLAEDESPLIGDVTKEPNRDCVEVDNVTPDEDDSKLASSQITNRDYNETSEVADPSDKPSPSKAKDVLVCSEDSIEPVDSQHAVDDVTLKSDKVPEPNDVVIEKGGKSTSDGIAESKPVEEITQVIERSQPCIDSVESKTIVDDAAVSGFSSCETRDEPCSEESKLTPVALGKDTNNAQAFSVAEELVTRKEEVGDNPDDEKQKPADESFHVENTSSAANKEEHAVVEEMEVSPTKGGEIFSTDEVDRVCHETSKPEETVDTVLLEPKVTERSAFLNDKKVNLVDEEASATTSEVSSRPPDPTQLEPSVPPKETESKEVENVTADKTIEPVLPEKTLSESLCNIDAGNASVEEPRTDPQVFTDSDTSVIQHESVELQLTEVKSGESTSIQSVEQNFAEQTPPELTSVETVEREGKSDYAKAISSAGDEINTQAVEKSIKSKICESVEQSFGDPTPSEPTSDETVERGGKSEIAENTSSTGDEVNTQAVEKPIKSKICEFFEQNIVEKTPSELTSVDIVECEGKSDITKNTTSAGDEINTPTVETTIKSQLCETVQQNLAEQTQSEPTSTDETVVREGKPEGIAKDTSSTGDEINTPTVEPTIESKIYKSVEQNLANQSPSEPTSIVETVECKGKSEDVAKDTSSTGDEISTPPVETAMNSEICDSAELNIAQKTPSEPTSIDTVEREGKDIGDNTSSAGAVINIPTVETPIKSETCETGTPKVTSTLVQLSSLSSDIFETSEALLIPKNITQKCEPSAENIVATKLDHLISSESAGVDLENSPKLAGEANEGQSSDIAVVSTFSIKSDPGYVKPEIQSSAPALKEETPIQACKTSDVKSPAESSEVPVQIVNIKKEEPFVDSEHAGVREVISGTAAAMDVDAATGQSDAAGESLVQSDSHAVKREVFQVEEEAEVESEISVEVKQEHTVTSGVKPETPKKVPSSKFKFSKFKSTYELMKSMDLGKPKEQYCEPDFLSIVNYEKLSFFTSRLKEIQKDSAIGVLTSKIVFVPYDFSDQFVLKGGLLCKRKDLQKNDVFIVLLKSTAVYREIVSALTEQYPDLEFNEFMSLIDSSFTYITPDEINSFTDTYDQKILSLNYHKFVERCSIVNFDIVRTMVDQLRTMQQADSAIAHRYNRLRANGGLDDSYILKYDLVCQFVGTLDFKVLLPKSQPDQIAIMYIVHETNHSRGLVEFLELMRATFEGVNVLLIDKPIGLCSVCSPPATAGAVSIVKACEQKCAALKLLPPEVIFKIRQVQMASSVYKAQIELLTKGQSRQGSRYILDSSLLCKAMTKGNQEVYRVVVSPSGLKEVISLLHTTYHRKSLDEFVSFVNEFMAVTKEVCKAAFQECCICLKSKAPKTPVDPPKLGTAEPVGKNSSAPPVKEENESSKEIGRKGSKPAAKLQSKAKDTVNTSEKKRSESPQRASKKGASGGDDSSKIVIKNTKDQESAKGAPKETPMNEPPKNPEPQPTKTWEVKEKATPPPKTLRGGKLRQAIKRDLRYYEQIWGSEIGTRVRNLLHIVPDRVLTEVAESQRSCPELMRSIKVLEKEKPVKDAKEILCGGILFTVKSKMKPKIAVKPIKHVNHMLITKMHSEVHDWNINKIHGTIGIAFDVSPSKDEIEETINWFCHKCLKPETRKKQKIYSSMDEQLEDFYKTLEPILNKAKALSKSESIPKKPEENTGVSEDVGINKAIFEDLQKLDVAWGKELGDKIKAITQPIPDTVLKAVIAAQRECTELMEIIGPLETVTPSKDARHVLCGGILFVVKSKKKAMLVKIHVKAIKNVNYILITNLHAACHDWTVNRLQTVIGLSFDVSPTREEVAVTIDWFCSQCQKPDTTSRKKKKAGTLDDQLKDLYDTIDPTLLKSKEEDDDQESTLDVTQEVPADDIRVALAKLPNPVVSKIQLAQMQSNVLNTQIKLLENADGPVKDKGHCLVMSLLCKLIELDGKLAWRVMIPSDILKELVLELHTVHYHDMIEEDFFDFVNKFMTVPVDVINELFSTCALCMSTVRRVPTLCERGVNEDMLRKTLASVAEMMDFVIKWQTECPAIAKIREGVKKCRAEAIADHLLYKDILFKLCGKTRGGKVPRPKIAVSLLPNALDEVIKSTHAFYHSNNPNQLMNLINVCFDVTVPQKLLVTKIPELCNICRKKNEKAKERDAADVSAGPAVESNPGSSDKEPKEPGTKKPSSDVPVRGKDADPDFVVKTEVDPIVEVRTDVDSPVQVKTEDESTPLGVLLLGRLCDQVIEESSNSSRALDSPVPEIPSTSDEVPLNRRTCKILLERCKYDPSIVQKVGDAAAKTKKTQAPKAGVKRARKPKKAQTETQTLPKAQESSDPSEESDSGSESTLPKRKFVVYSSESEAEESTSKKRKATAGSSQKPKRKK